MRAPLFFLPSVCKLLKPKRRLLGADLAGRVESVGADIKTFHPAEEVFGASFQGKGPGGFAEYVCATEDVLALKPANLSFEEAAAVPVAAITALQGLRDQGKIERGQRVLIDGASGGVGTFAVQIAKILRSGSDSRVQSGERREGTIVRRRLCHRLHPAEFHAKRPALRSHSRGKRISFDLRLTAGAPSRRDFCNGLREYSSNFPGRLFGTVAIPPGE